MSHSVFCASYIYRSLSGLIKTELGVALSTTIKVSDDTILSTPFSAIHYISDRIICDQKANSGGIKGPGDVLPLVGVRISMYCHRLQPQRRITKATDLKDGNRDISCLRRASAELVIILIA